MENEAITTKSASPLPYDDAIWLRDAINTQQYQRGLWKGDNPTVSCLFNKGRYFEMSVYNQTLLELVAEEIDIKPEYGNMLVGGKEKLEAMVLAFNTLGWFVIITIDWI